MSVIFTPNTADKSTKIPKKRTLSSPVDSNDHKKSRNTMSENGAADKTFKQSSTNEGVMDTSATPSGMSQAGSIPQITTSDVQHTTNITLSNENMCQITSIIMDSIHAQTAELVKGIVDGVLSGLNDEISTLKEENIFLKTKVTELEDKLDKAEQYSRRNCLRLSGIPEDVNESVEDKVMKVAQAIDADLSVHEIDRTHRVGRPKHKKDQRPRDIIIKFVSYRSRRKMLENKRKMKDIEYSKAYLNEDLTTARNKIYYHCRKLVKDGLILGTWSADGVILLKTRDSKVHRIETMSDLVMFKSDNGMA